MPLSKFKFSKSWITNPRGQDDSYKKKDQTKSHSNKSIRKEGDGGGFGEGGGTVFTSQDTGVFTPTYGSRAERKKKKKKKKTGIERLGAFLNDQSPERKMQKSLVPATLELIDWVRKELQKDDVKFRQQTSPTGINDQTKQTDGLRNPVEFDSKPDDKADIEQKDMEKKIRNLDDSEDIKDEKPDEKGNAGDVAPAGLSVQLAYGSGPEKGPLVTGGYKDKNKGRIAELEEEAEETPFK